MSRDKIKVLVLLLEDLRDSRISDEPYEEEDELVESLTSIIDDIYEEYDLEI